jgi:3-oxoadipate enol-lactonase
MEMKYDDQGSGTPVLLIHGLGGTGNVWGGCVASLSRHFRTLCPDLIGSGRSPSSGDITTPSLVQALLGFMDELGLERAHLVGHSYGSVLVQHLAVSHPARVRSLSLIGPILAPGEPARKALAERAAKARAEGLVAVANATVQVATSALTKADRPEVAAFVRELVMGQNPGGYAATCEAIAKTEPARIETLKCPTLVITGDEDTTSPPPVAKALADKIPGCRFHVLTGCGHWTPLERTQPLTEQLFNFLLSNN